MIDEQYLHSKIPPGNDKNKVLSIVQETLKKNFPEGELLFLITWGSRSHGLYDMLSDWDLIAIMRNIKQPDLELCTIEIGPFIDVTVYEQSQFQQFLDDHTIYIIPLIYFPQTAFLYGNE